MITHPVGRKKKPCLTKEISQKAISLPILISSVASERFAFPS
jgi:hypothetical protein